MTTATGYIAVYEEDAEGARSGYVWHGRNEMDIPRTCGFYGLTSYGTLAEALSSIRDFCDGTLARQGRAIIAAMG